VAGKTVQYMFFDLFKDYTELKAELLGSSCFINDGKGGFKRIDLPDELQLAPVMTFNQMQKPGSFIAAGNFYGTIPYEGKYDGLSPTVFSFDKNKGRFNINYKTVFIKEEVRDVKWLQDSKGKKLLLAGNNSKLIFLKPKSE
jgi:hypothetical protein